MQCCALFCKLFTCLKVIFPPVILVKFENTFPTCFPLNLPWKFSWHLVFSLLLLVIILPRCTRNFWWLKLFMGDILVFSACFDRKFWILFKLSILTHSSLNITWSYLWYFHFSSLFTVIFSPWSTRNLQQCMSFKGELFVYLAHKVQTLLKISVLTIFLFNIYWNSSWQLLFKRLLSVIIVPVSMRKYWRRTSLKGGISVFSVCLYCISLKSLSSSVFHWITLKLITETSSSDYCCC